MAETPPEGPGLTFDRWCRELVSELRGMLPDARATRKGKVLTIRYAAREATVTDGGETRWVKFGYGSGLSISRHDGHTARTAAKTLAGSFDPRWSKG